MERIEIASRLLAGMLAHHELALRDDDELAMFALNQADALIAADAKAQPQPERPSREALMALLEAVEQRWHAPDPEEVEWYKSRVYEAMRRCQREMEAKP